MGYKEINDTWKNFINEYAFKENKPKLKKEIINNGDSKVEQEGDLDENEEPLEEMSSMGAGAVEGFAGPIGNLPVKKKKRLK